MSTNTTEEQLKEAYRNIGDYYWDRQNWASAREYYTLANHQDGVIKCHVALEDHEALANLSISSPRKSAPAPPKQELKHQVESETLNNEPPTLAMALQLKEAGKLAQAAAIIFRLAESEDADRTSPIKMKKLYVLAGLLYQSAGDSTSATGAFQKAGSWHWLGLAQGGSLPAALRLRSRRPPAPRPVPALTALALNAANARAFATCSEAFVQLEALPESDTYEELAVEIFNKHSPIDPKVNRAECAACHTMVSEWSTCCLNCGANFPGCTLSGLSIRDTHSVWSCRTCSSSVAQQEVVLRQTCPVCHTPVK